MIRFIKIFILLSELLNGLKNSSMFVAWVQNLRFLLQLALQKSVFLIEFRAIFNPECIQCNLRCVI